MFESVEKFFLAKVRIVVVFSPETHKVNFALRSNFQKVSKPLHLENQYQLKLYVFF